MHAVRNQILAHSERTKASFHNPLIFYLVHYMYKASILVITLVFNWKVVGILIKVVLHASVKHCDCPLLCHVTTQSGRAT